MIRLDRQAAVRGQVQPQEVSALAAQGVTVLVNNRPDGEEPDQPHAHEIEDAAAAAGIAYHHIPIARGIGPAEVAAMSQALEEAQGGQLLAFCRSGNRSALALALAKRERGESAEEVRRCLTDAGFDSGPIAHLL